MKGFGQLKKLLGFGKNSVKEAKKEDKTSGLEQGRGQAEPERGNACSLCGFLAKQPDQRKMYFI